VEDPVVMADIVGEEALAATEAIVGEEALEGMVDIMGALEGIIAGVVAIVGIMGGVVGSYPDYLLAVF
jgi:ammonia channel protein AmtB